MGHIYRDNDTMIGFETERGNCDHVKAELLIEDRRKTVELQVRRAFLTLEDAQQTVLSQLENVSEAKDAVREAAEREQAGVITQFEVRDTQLSLTRARTNLLVNAHCQFSAGYRFSR